MNVGVTWGFQYRGWVEAAHPPPGKLRVLSPKGSVPGIFLQFGPSAEIGHEAVKLGHLHGLHSGGMVPGLNKSTN